jgi:hypothetical protein
LRLVFAAPDFPLKAVIIIMIMFITSFNHVDRVRELIHNDIKQFPPLILGAGARGGPGRRAIP